MYSPLFVGLKKKGAITAIALAPMAAACLAYKRENEKNLKVQLLYMYDTHGEKESHHIIYAPALGTLADLVLPHE